jgi:tRNA A-37 threonylcarbamoyl transferase component Bud32/NADH:ubiquinone oxidoreductase subunit K
MQGPRAPWPVYAVAACVSGFFLLNSYADLRGPGAIGVDLRFRRDQAVVIAVVEGSPAALVGVEAGDRIAAVRGQQIRTLFHWRVALENAEVGQPLALAIDRGGVGREASIILGANWRGWTASRWATFSLKIAAQLVTLALALLIAVRRPRDHVAITGALFLAALSVTNFVPTTGIDPHSPSLPYGAAAIWRGLPPWLGAPLWVGFLVFAMGPLLQTQFFAVFPRPFFRTSRAWWLWGLAWLPVIAFGVPGLLYDSYRGVYDPEHFAGALPDWFTLFVGMVVVAAVVVGMVLLILNYRRLADRNERRRLRVLVLGTIVGMGGVTPTSMASFFDLPVWLSHALRSPAALAASSALFLVLPVSYAYAVLRHQIFDIRVILRQGLQYALARGLVVSLVPACAVVLSIDLLMHRNQPLADIVLSRGWIYAAVAGLAWAAHVQRRRWLDALDRRFFRERYDAQRLMRQVVEEIRGAAGLESVAPQLVEQIAAALHPEYVALLTREQAAPAYRIVASVPAGGIPLALRADSKVAALVRLLGKPLDVGPGRSGWVRQQLPPGEADLLHAARAALLVPVATPPAGPEVLLVLGEKRSEEPYSSEDQEFLAVLAASLGLIVDRPAPGAPADGFSECPRCGSCDDTGAARCARDGALLDVVRLPRLLAKRYRLDRRLGRGGMGTVYEAFDTALDRSVAVKVIREELVGSASAAERFRLEARAAAGFSHPNVVTIHDFGVVMQTRAFLVMELLRGVTLRDEMRAQPRLEPARVVAVLRDLAAAVDAAHARHLVHRDLKPENVFLAGDAHDQVKLLDFGLAKFLAGDSEGETAAATGAGIIVGTARYMGPEQLRGLGADLRCDLWAIAVMAYEMLSGALPFSGEATDDYQRAVLGGRPTPIRMHVPDAPARVEELFAGALALDPSRRPGRASAFVAELERALG